MKYFAYIEMPHKSVGKTFDTLDEAKEQLSSSIRVFEVSDKFSESNFWHLSKPRVQKMNVMYNQVHSQGYLSHDFI